MYSVLARPSLVRECVFFSKSNNAQIDRPICHVLCRYGEWSKILSMAQPPKGARGITKYGGQEFSQVVYYYCRLLALAAKADAAQTAVLKVRPGVVEMGLLSAVK